MVPGLPCATVVVVSDIKIKEDDEAYLEKHKIAEMMQKLLERVLKDKPARPVSFMIEEIWRLRVGGAAPARECLRKRSQHSASYWSPGHPQDEHITQTLEETAAKQ